MGSIILPDGFVDHPCVVTLGGEAFRMYVAAICYSERYGLHGCFREDVAVTLGRGDGEDRQDTVDELVAAGLFVRSWPYGNDGYIKVADLRDEPSEG